MLKLDYQESQPGSKQGNIGESMNANDVLIDLLEDNRRRLKRTIEQISDESLYWHPDRETNSIAVTVWHMARIFDVFLTRQVGGQPAEEESWFKHGWAVRTNYDPRGLGRDGWGMVMGYSIPDMEPRCCRCSYKVGEQQSQLINSIAAAMFTFPVANSLI
jgi:hypothetical protein